MRLLLGLACAAASIRAILHLTVRSLERQYIWTDFALFYASVNRWLDGRPMYAESIPMFGAPTWTESVNFNPPQLHLLVLPFAHMNLWPALMLWLLASVVVGGICAAIVVRTLRPNWTPVAMLAAAAIVLNSAALSSTLWFGQMSLFLALPVTLAWRAYRIGRWNAAAGWTGLAASIKPFFFIVLPYLVIKRQWRALPWAFGAWALSFAVGLAVFGPAVLVQWLDASRWPTWQSHFHNASFHAYVGRVMWEWPGELVATAGSVLGVVATIWLARERDADAAWALLMTGALLWAPLGWVYYQWFLMPPLAAIAADRRMPPAAWLLLVPFLWPINGYPLRLTGTLLDAQIWSMYFWGLLALWLLLCTSAIRPPARAAEEGLEGVGGGGPATVPQGN